MKAHHDLDVFSAQRVPALADRWNEIRREHNRWSAEYLDVAHEVQEWIKTHDERENDR